MGLTSRTGLVASPTKKIQRYVKTKTVQLRAIANPAPFTLKPFATLYNPHPYGCSLLCNHPTDGEARELLRKAKDAWAADGRNVLLAGEIEAIRAGVARLPPPGGERLAVPVGGSVPEELFRRYTDTDSRPLTPAPTVASAATRASGSRRCFTPEPIKAHEVREKTLLILDLRRSHSQETLSWQGASSLDPPIIRIQRVPTRQSSAEEKSPKISIFPNARSTTPVQAKPKRLKKEPEVIEIDKATSNEPTELIEVKEEEDDFIKRRGKKRRKKRDGSQGPPPFQGSADPETQVATIGPDSRLASARPSLVPSQPSEEVAERAAKNERSDEWAHKSYIDADILKQLRRALNEEIVDNEFGAKRRVALEEALKTIEAEAEPCAALRQVQAELNLPAINADLWLNLPRKFSRASARFELPMDSRTLEGMTVFGYLKGHVFISSGRKLLYNCIFGRYKRGEGIERTIEGAALQGALNLMMGRAMKPDEAALFRDLVEWRDADRLDFRTFCGICALCERLLAKEFYPQLADRKTDPCHEIESADFQALSRKLHGRKVNVKLVRVLEGLKEL